MSVLTSTSTPASTVTSGPPSATAAAGPGSAAAARRGRAGRLGLAALVAGAALNTAEAVLQSVFSSSAQGGAAGRFADAAAHPVGVPTFILAGTFAVPLILVGLTAVARLLRPALPRLAATSTALVFVGCFGFFGMHVLSLLAYAGSQLDDRAAAVAVFDGITEHPIGLVLLVPFLLGLFPGLLLLSLGLLRTRLVPRWIPVTWLVFLVLDLTAANATPVDPHWLWLVGAVGLAVHVMRTSPGAAQAAANA